MKFYYSQYFDRLDDKIASYKVRYGWNYKRIALKLAYWNLCFLFKKKHINSSFNDSQQHILFEVCGGVGDLVISGSYISAFAQKFGKNTVIDILLEKAFFESGKVIYSQIEGVNNIITETSKRYDLTINLVRYPVIKQFFPKRLQKDLVQYVEHINSFHAQNPLVAKNDFFGRCYAQEQGRYREDEADIDNLLDMHKKEWQLSSPKDEKINLQKFGLRAKKYITMHTGYGKHFIGVEKETRQWPEENYSKLTQMLKKAHSEYQIVQIGETRQSKIDGTDIDLRGKTTFEEMLSILKNAKLHISQEGGMAIIRHFLKGGPSVTLFGPTDESFYGFKENINITARCCPHPCEWLCKSWMKKCMSTGNVAKCIQLLTPDIVFKEIKENINL